MCLHAGDMAVGRRVHSTEARCTTWRRLLLRRLVEGEQMHGRQGLVFSMRDRQTHDSGYRWIEYSWEEVMLVHRAGRRLRKLF